ncbi:hypothetical protein FOZ60_007236 [Perkinsus olseni]|uniref:Tetratricopeptide repeat protein 29 n=1 Tax=Perkinsus olseni TaxID=32597 RepID=A0A7J6PET1_PEROL|nr:hypothetical protein FOZ60_007236 [Perkinsus olseni]
MSSSQTGEETISSTSTTLDSRKAVDTNEDELMANPGMLWSRLSDFERSIARTRKDILNSSESVTATDLRECVHNARADWPAAVEPFKDVEDALERLLPYHACYEQDTADDSTAQLDKARGFTSAVKKEAKLCREATRRDAAKRKFNVVKSIELEELTHKSGRLRQEIDRIEREIQLKRAAAKLQSTEIKAQDSSQQPADSAAAVKTEGKVPGAEIVNLQARLLTSDTYNEFTGRPSTGRWLDVQAKAPEVCICMIKTELMDLQGGIITLERALELALSSSSDSDSSTSGPNLSHLIAADLATFYMRLADDADFWAADSEQPLQQSNAEKCDALVVAGRVWSSTACYERALECAQFDSDEAIEGLASFKFGTARLEVGDLEGALALQWRYLEISQRFADLKGEAASRALSKIYQRLGDKRAAIEELDVLRNAAEDAGEITTAADACLDLAVLTYHED